MNALRAARNAALCCLLAAVSRSQTTQGLIAGSVVNVLDGRPLSTAVIRYTQLESLNSGVAAASADGRFTLPLLPPGTYRIRVDAKGFQAQEVHQLRLYVAGTLDMVFRLRPLGDVWEQRERHNLFLSGNSVAVFFGPDVDLNRTASVEADPGRNGILQSTLSQVVSPQEIREAPLAGRDVYALLALQPGVTSDAATSRGLGLSVNGQRPSSTNYLLDGLENNNYLLTGPLILAAPEGVQEYRVSTNNFSAEYGRTSGVVANVITKSGGTAWHGLAYMNYKNEALNANEFQRNRLGEARIPNKEIEPGFFLGGPLPGEWFVSASFDQVRFRGRGETRTITAPSLQFLAQLNPASDTGKLLATYRPPAVTGSGPCVLGESANEAGCAGDIDVAPPNTLDRTLAFGRIDHPLRAGADRLMLRLALSRVTKPDFSWTPYKDFVSPLNQNGENAMLSWTSAPRPRLTVEARIGWSTDDLVFDRANSQTPLISGPAGMYLPGSLLYYSYRNRSRSLETLGAIMVTRARHIWKIGGGLLDRRLDGYQTTGQEPTFPFLSATDLAADRPFSMSVTVSRLGPAETRPSFDRDYRYRQWFGYAQGSWRASSRLNVNYGVRYENFGTPINTGATKDTVVALGAGNSLQEALVSATGYYTPGPGNQRLYDPDRNDWTGRLGFAYAFDDRGQTVLRGAYGLFYDRPFDNLWQTIRHNSLQQGTVFLNGRSWDYLNPAQPLPGPLAQRREIFQGITLFQPGFRTPYVQSAFVSLRRMLTRNLSLEVSGMNSLGRKLIATDTVNRGFDRASTDFPDISYRSNQGNSNYYGGAAVLAYRGRSSLVEVSYTLSHAIDNQSDPLAGENTDLGFAGNSSAPVLGQAAFSAQYDSRGDRGSSNFDQRHSLTAAAVVELPSPRWRGAAGAVLRDWRVSTLAAARSGSPYTVFANSPLDIENARLINNRGNLIDPAGGVSEMDYPGGRRLLNPAAFSPLAVGQRGNTGRNAFPGPGFWNVDLSLSRFLRVPWLGEQGRFVIRADAYNALNHANLGTPGALYGSSAFGIALYGRTGYDTGFPAVVPFRESARSVQFLLRVEF
jgi:hypothetical protein